jgi:hypothetical protein
MEDDVIKVLQRVSKEKSLSISALVSAAVKESTHSKSLKMPILF